MNDYSISKTPYKAQFEISEKFRKLRKQKKISQNVLAQKAGVSLGSLKRFELSGQISLQSLLKLSHFFDRLEDFDEVFKQKEDLKEIEKLFKKIELKQKM